jgi:hypothetical protein
MSFGGHSMILYGPPRVFIISMYFMTGTSPVSDALHWARVHGQVGTGRPISTWWSDPGLTLV